MHEALFEAARKVRASGAEDVALRWGLGRQIGYLLSSGKFGITDIDRLLSEAGLSFPRTAIRAMQELGKFTEDELNYLIKDSEGEDSPWAYFYNTYRDARRPQRKPSVRRTDSTDKLTVVAQQQFGHLGYADRAAARELVQDYMSDVEWFRRFVEEIEAVSDASGSSSSES